MDDRTITALRASIAKWEAIVAGTGCSQGQANCALCQMFPTCEGCPVEASTGLSGCYGTPYYDFMKSTSLEIAEKNTETLFIGAYARTPAAKAAAQRELDFLRSLLPEDER